MFTVRSEGENRVSPLVAGVDMGVGMRDLRKGEAFVDDGRDISGLVKAQNDFKAFFGRY